MRSLVAAVFGLTAFVYSFPRTGSVEVPEGTVLQVRQTTSVGTKVSKRGDHVAATLIAPVFLDGRVVIPAGSTLDGTVRDSVRIGLGFRHHTAAMDYRFHTLRFPDNDALRIDCQIIAVESAKERVDAAGRIHGIRPTWNVSSSLAAYAWRLVVLEPAAGLSVWATKMLFAPSPDPEIHFPVGTELRLRLTKPLAVSVRWDFQPPPAPPAPGIVDRLREILSALPAQRIAGKNGNPSDLLNLLFVGSDAQIRRAFEAAGWLHSDRRTTGAMLRSYFSIVARRGYPTAPMAPLRFDGVLPDRAWQKGFNTMGKRHHLRVWRLPDFIDGAEVWVSSATEDTGIGFSLKSTKFTHTIDENIDWERTKVANDLMYTGCVEAVTLLDRGSEGSAEGGESRTFRTDGLVAAIVLNDCQAPRRFPGLSAKNRDGFGSALASLKDDLIRSNFASIVSGTARLATAPKSWFKAGKNAIHAVNDPHREQAEWMSQPAPAPEPRAID